VKLGYRTFNDSREAADYLQEVLKKATPHRKLNEVCVTCRERMGSACRLPQQLQQQFAPAAPQRLMVLG
jgi:hypothetical protein